MHVAQASGNYEWYTPPQIVSMAREVLGGTIDLDPASTETANQIVKARYFIGEIDDALNPNTLWETGEGGTVFINPPYRTDLIEEFVNRLQYEMNLFNVLKAVWLSNNATETQWAQKLFNRSKVVCFPSRRIPFLDQELEPVNTPLQGQMIVGMGQELDPEKFRAVFSELGTIMTI